MDNPVGNDPLLPFNSVTITHAPAHLHRKIPPVRTFWTMTPATPTPPALSAIDELRCALDAAAFAELRLGLSLDPWQIDVVRSVAPRMAMACSRQIGKSTVTGIKASHVAIYEPGALIICLAPGLRQASELLRKIRANLVSAAVPLVGDAATQLELANGSRILSLPASSDLIRGYSAVRLILADECAFFETDDVLDAATPMLATNPSAQLILLSTFNLAQGAFYNAFKPNSGFETYKIDVRQCPRITQAFLDAELARCGEQIFAREYMCAIMSEGEFAFFGADILSRLAEREGKPALHFTLFT